MHPEAPRDCTNPSKVHTISRAAALSGIASDGHVVALAPDLFDVVRDGPSTGARYIGLNDASTFLGFCNAHDVRLFAPIDRPFTPSREVALLLHYRAVCYELHKKRAIVDVYKAFVAQARGDGERYDREFSEMAYRQGTNWTQVGIADLEAEKAALDDLVRRNEPTTTHFTAFLFDAAPPLVACGAFAPEWDVKGRVLQDIAAAKAGAMQCTSLTLVPNGAMGIGMLAWIGDRAACTSLAHSLIDVPREDTPAVFTRLAMQMVENAFAAPSWWHLLGDDQRQAILLRLRAPQEYSAFARPGVSVPLNLRLSSIVTDA